MYGSSNVRGGVSYLYFEQFEFIDSIQDWGWFVGNSGDGNMIVETRSSAAQSGDRGLYMKSVPNGVVEIVLDLNLHYQPSMILDLQILNIQNSAIIRIAIAGDQGYIQFDYGSTGAGWEFGVNIYDVDSAFPLGEWYNLERNLSDDIAQALSDNNSPFTTFTPHTLVNFIIFQDGDGGLIREIYFDDLTIIAHQEYVAENQIVDAGTVTETVTFANPNTVTLTQESPSSGLDGFGSLGWLLFVVTGIVFYFKVSGRKELEGNYRQTQSRNITPPQTCSKCGSFREPNTLFCGDCGKRY
jgi:hypothetical protein